MQVFYVQIKCELGKAYEVADIIIEDIHETMEIYSTSGPFDLLAKFQLSDEQSIGEFVNARLHKVPGIRDTLSIMTFKLFGGRDHMRLDESKG